MNNCQNLQKPLKQHRTNSPQQGPRYLLKMRQNGTQRYTETQDKPKTGGLTQKQHPMPQNTAIVSLPLHQVTPTTSTQEDSRHQRTQQSSCSRRPQENTGQWRSKIYFSVNIFVVPLAVPKININPPQEDKPRKQEPHPQKTTIDKLWLKRFNNPHDTWPRHQLRSATTLKTLLPCSYSSASVWRTSMRIVASRTLSQLSIASQCHQRTALSS